MEELVPATNSLRPTKKRKSSAEYLPARTPGVCVCVRVRACLRACARACVIHTWLSQSNINIVRMAIHALTHEPSPSNAHTTVRTEQ